jgi:hypothetical protein
MLTSHIQDHRRAAPADGFHLGRMLMVRWFGNMLRTNAAPSPPARADRMFTWWAIVDQRFSMDLPDRRRCHLGSAFVTLCAAFLHRVDPRLRYAVASLHGAATGFGGLSFPSLFQPDLGRREDVHLPPRPSEMDQTKRARIQTPWPSR